MKIIKKNLNLMIFLFVIFLTFPIQDFLTSKLTVIIIAAIVNVLLIVTSVYLISSYISNFLNHTKKYHLEISKIDLMKMASLNNNFKFYLKMIIILVFFGISISSTLNTFERIGEMTSDIKFLTNKNITHFFDSRNLSILSLSVFISINVLLLYSVIYIIALYLFYLILKTVVISNIEFINGIYKEVTKFEKIIQIMMDSFIIQNFFDKSIDQTWEEKVVLINYNDSLKLKKSKMVIIPPKTL